jgi:hypothetical protein
MLNDKSETERYFILSLFAIDKELAEETELLPKLYSERPYEG